MADIGNQGLRFLWKTGQGDVQVDGTNIKSSDIVFLPERDQIFVDGNYFGITPTQAAALSKATTDIGKLDHGVQALNARVEMSTSLSKTLLQIANELKQKQDGGAFSGDHGAQGGATIGVQAANGDDITNLTDAVNRIYDMAKGAQSAAASAAQAGVLSVGNASGDTSIEISGNGSGPYTGAITIKTDASKIKTVTAQSKTDGKGVDINAGTSIDLALGTINTALVGIQGDIATAQTSANGKIALSPTDTTNEALSGVQGANLTTAAAIADAIEAAYGQLLGVQGDFDNNEAKTLGQLRTLIKALRGDVTSLQNTVSGMDKHSAQKILDIINELKQVSDSDSGDFADTILDRLTPFLAYASTHASDGTANGAQGYYEVDKLDGTQSYVNNVQGIIDALTSEIAAAKNAGVQAGVTTLNTGAGNITLSGTQGVQVDAAPTNGTITVKGTSAALTTDALTQTGGYGANTAAGSTVQTALQDVNNVAAGAASAAATADGKAVAAQSDATNALNQLKWVVVS